MNDSMRQKQIKKYYDEGGYFDKAVRYRTYADLFRSRLQRYRIREVLRLSDPRKTDKVLDLGCALGNISFAVAPRVRHVTGLDYSDRAVAFARKLLRTSPFKNIRFVRAGAEKTGLPTGTFDLIISADLFEHLYPGMYLKTLRECSRLLKKGGRLLVWTPNRGHIIEILKNNNILLKKDISHVDYKSMARIRKDLEKIGFRIVKACYRPSHLPVFSLVERMLIPVMPLFRRRIGILAVKG